jgi:hypothetical protein
MKKLIDSKFITSAHARSGDHLPESFIDSINSYSRPQLLNAVGIFDAEKLSHYGDQLFFIEKLGFIPFLEFNSNYFYIGCRGAFSGLVSLLPKAYFFEIVSLASFSLRPNPF